jgi:threonine/homoserine/homoserine lactone efflux protein
MIEIKAIEALVTQNDRIEFLPFILATFSLLAVPGPTNTLLATSGAGAGVSRSLHLLAAELGGYLTAVVVQRLVLGPLVIASRWQASFDLPSRSVCSISRACSGAIVRVSWRTPRRHVSGSAAHHIAQPQGGNFAFMLLPPAIGFVELTPWIAMMAVQIVAVGAAWLTLGATLGRGLRGLGHPELMYKLSAIALVVTATVIGARSLGMV